MSDLARLARKISRCLGVEVVLTTDYEAKTPLIVATVDDREQSGNTFRVALGPPSKREDNLRRVHSMIYLARGKQRFRQQKGLCGICGKPMKGSENTEIDHIETRGAHGRSDLMSNLRVVHGEPCHRQRHSAALQRRTAWQAC